MLYVPDEKDRVVVERAIPAPNWGAPEPIVVASEDRLLLSYAAHYNAPANMSQRTIYNPLGVVVTSVIIEFARFTAYFSVPISNETIQAHPLTRRGVESCGVYRVENSSWIRWLAGAQCVHPRPFPERYDNCKHYIFAFHDSIFEVAADGVAVRDLSGTVAERQQEIWRLLHTPGSG